MDLRKTKMAARPSLALLLLIYQRACCRMDHVLQLTVLTQVLTSAAHEEISLPSSIEPGDDVPH